jgi:hypothetical protein
MRPSIERDGAEHVHVFEQDHEVSWRLNELRRVGDCIIRGTPGN